MHETGPQKVDIDEAEKQIRLIVDDVIGLQKCGEHLFLSLEKYIDWSFAACLATLIWFMGSFDKFKVSGEFYNKYSFILAVLLLLASVFCFGIYRYVLHNRAIIENLFLKSASELLYGFPSWNLPNGEKAYSPKEEQITTIRKNMKNLHDFTDRWGGKRSCALEYGGIIFFLTGLMLAGFCITSLVFNIDEAYVIRSLVVGPKITLHMFMILALPSSCIA
jgi:hypothetical protein